jgi:hypothetical protein
MAEAWQTNAPGPFLTVGDVTVWTAGDQRFVVRSPSGDHHVEGFERARQLARELAGMA